MPEKITTILANTGSSITTTTLYSPFDTCTPSDGLWLQDDTSPTTGAMGTSYSALIDGDYETAAVPTAFLTATGSYFRGYMDNYFRPTGFPWRFDAGTEETTSPVENPEQSVGLYLGATAVAVRRLAIYDNSATGGILWNDDFTNSTLDVYKSDDNSTWTLVERFSPVRRIVVVMPESTMPFTSPAPSPYPEISPSEKTDIYMTELIFSEAQTAKYFKVHAANGWLKDASGAYLHVTEMRAWKDKDTTTVTVTRSKPAVKHVTKIVPVYDSEAETYDSTYQEQEHTMVD